MNFRRFGRTGWNVSEIGYGMWGMAGWTGSDDDESLGSPQHAVDLGCKIWGRYGFYDAFSEQAKGLARNYLDFWTPNRTPSSAAAQSPNPHCSPLQLRFGSIGASKYEAPLDPKLSN